MCIPDFFFSTKTYVVGTQKNHLNEMVLLSTQNIYLDCWVRKQLQFYSQKFCLTGPMVLFCYFSDGLQEYFKMVLAGLAGSPQMISATLLALTRILYEFKGNFNP